MAKFPKDDFLKELLKDPETLFYYEMDWDYEKMGEDISTLEYKKMRSEAWEFINRMGVKNPTYSFYKKLNKIASKKIAKQSASNNMLGVSLSSSTNTNKEDDLIMNNIMVTENIDTSNKQKVLDFLKQDDNSILLNSGDFYTLFNKCSSLLKRSLYEMLKESNIQIVDALHDEGTHYCLKSKSGYVLIIGGKDGNYYKTDLSSDNSKCLIVFPTFEEAIKASLHFLNLYIEPLNQSFINDNKWVEVILKDNMKDVKSLITQNCFDKHDPQKQKEIRYYDAAKEEYDRRVSDEILNIMLPTQDKSKLQAALYDLSTNSDNFRIYKQVPTFIIEIEYDPSDEFEIKSLIKSYLKLPADIVKINKGFKIIPKGKRLDKIADEIMDEFGIEI